MIEPKQFTAEEELTRGRQALAVLENEIFKEACALIEGGLASQRQRISMNDTDAHTRLILTEQLWLGIKDHLQQIADTGKWAQDEVNRQERERNSFLRRILSGSLRAA